MATNLEDKVKDLEAKVAELYDREALRDLRYRYHECINEAQMAAIPDLFTDDGELDFGHLGKAKGREEINKFFSGLGRFGPLEGTAQAITPWQLLHRDGATTRRALCSAHGFIAVG